MSYTKLTDFAVKDALLSGNPAKVIRGVEFDAEFNEIVAADALNTKAAALAASSGSSLVGFIQSGAGAVATTVQGKLRESVSVKDFGADPTGGNAAATTAAIQAAVDAGCKVTFAPTGTYAVSSRINLHDNSHIDLNGSTIEWVGPVVDNTNKANKWDNSVFSANLTLAAPSTVKKNIHIRNGTINCNDWGVAVSFKQVEGFSITDLVITEAQCAGINTVDCLAGSIERCHLIDCAANPASGFNPTDLEAWSDGMAVWYGSQNVSVNNCSITNTRIATGRCGIFFEGTSAESFRITSQCSMNNCTVRGYDRQFHAELANNISAYNCSFDTTSSGFKSLSSSIVVWNTDNTAFVGCRITSKSHALTHSAGIRTTFIGCALESTEMITPGLELFRNLDGLTSSLKFTDCLIGLKLCDAVLIECSALFSGCTFAADSYRLSNFYHGDFTFTDCNFTRVGVRTANGIPTDTYTYTNCTWQGVSSGQEAIASTSILKNTIVNCEPNGARIYSDSPIEITGKTFQSYNLVGSGGPNGYVVNGSYYGAGIPITGTYKRGDTLITYTPSANAPYSWVCVVAGTPGTWKVLSTTAP